jgi:polar amino acid transport system substrate-binding protein
MLTYRFRTLSFALGAIVLTFGVTACSGSTKKAADTTAVAAETTPAEATTVAGAGAKGTEMNQALHDALPDSIKKSGKMTLATDPTDPPLEFYDAANVLVGAEVDLAAAMGKVLGVKVDMVPSKFDAIIPGVEAGRFDGSLSGFADRKERQKVVDFVDFFTSSRGYLIKKGTFPELATATDLCGRKVAVAKGTTMADSLVELNAACAKGTAGAIDGQIYPDQAACVLAVQSSRADLTILSDHAALAIAQNSKGELDVILRPTEGNDINGIVLKKGVLTAPVLGAIQQLYDAGIMLEIFTKWNLQALLMPAPAVNTGTN